MNPIVILHLSDLHFGEHCRFAKEDPKELGKNLAQSVQDILKRKIPDNPQKVNLAAVTGDIAGTAHKNEYATAVKFFEALSGGLGIAREKFVFTPGNHDVSWPACKKVDCDKELDELNGDYETILHSKKFDPFENYFIKAFFGKSWNELAKHLLHKAFVYEPDDMNLSVATLNSCELESHVRQMGHISKDQAQSLMNYWKHKNDQQKIRIVMVHHNPFATVDENVEDLIRKWKMLTEEGKGPDEEWMHRFASEATGFEGKQFLEQICDQCKVTLTLCGHQHAPKTETWTWNEGGQTRLLSAGSLGVKDDELPKDYSNNVKVLIIDPNAGLLENCSLVFNPKAQVDGSVRTGCFVLDNTRPDCQQINHLYIPISAAPKSAPDAKASATTAEKELSAFYAEYRDRLSPFRDMWELSALGGNMTRGKDNLPVQCKLEDMYQPIRMIKAGSNNSENVGITLTARQILERTQPLIIKGPAGSGKTTWIRYIFKSLLKMEDCLPVIIELRRLARVWNDLSAVCQERSIDSYLAAWISDNGLAGWKNEIDVAFKSENGQRPVLLVDGWDELGELGTEFRYKFLGFMKAHPRVLAIVTSRPYGKEPPRTSDSFEEMDIQPLNKNEIRLFATRFYNFCCGEDSNACVEKTVDFMSRLGNLPQAAQLAKNPLLLTMLLFINRTSPLPDKRHLLYEQCINNMLTTLPERRRDEGVQALKEHWCPSDSEERFQLTSRIALTLQDAPREYVTKNILVEARMKDLEKALPEEWPMDKKQCFILWLAGPCGILSDKADGTYSFSHLSFQEYLAARALEADTTGDADRKVKFKGKIENVVWWETLRLWAALVGGVSIDRVDGLLEALMKDKNTGYFICGSILADGVGGQGIFKTWLDRFPTGCHLKDLNSYYGFFCAIAWKNSDQSERRSQIDEQTNFIAHECSWLEWLWLDNWRKRTGFGDTAMLSIEGNPSKFVLENLFSNKRSETNLAYGRVLESFFPVWPIKDKELVFLRLWPCQRASVSATLQNLSVLCANAIEFEHKLAKKQLLSYPPMNLEIRKKAVDLTINLTSELKCDSTINFDSPLACNVARILALNLARNLARNLNNDMTCSSDNTLAIYWGQCWARYWNSYLNSYWARDWTNNWARDLARDLANDLANNFSEYFGKSTSSKRLFEFGALEAFSFGRVGPSFIIANLAGVKENGLWALFREACRLYYKPNSDIRAFLKAVKECKNKVHIIWSALAKHVARLSTPEDRELLVDYAMHPEKAEPPLSWGLKYMVRGDVMVSPGEVITLNELADQHGIPHLPYLEDMPDELDLGKNFEKIGDVFKASKRPATP